MVDYAKKTSWIFILLLAAVLLNGCVSIKTRPLPDTTGPLSIEITGQFSKSSEFDIHNFDIKRFDATVEVGKGDEKIPSAIFYLPMGRFILLGTGLSDSVKEGLWNEKDQLTLDLMAEAKESLLKELSGSAGRFSLNKNPNQGSVQVIPGICVHFSDKDKVRLWMSLDAKSTSSNPNQAEWNCLYIVGVGDPRPLSGRKERAFHRSESFKKEAAEGFRLAFRTLLDDLDGKIRNEKAPQVTVTLPSSFDFNFEPREAQLLKTTKNGTMVLIPQIWFGSTTIVILPKDFQVTPVEPKSKESSK